MIVPRESPLTAIIVAAIATAAWLAPPIGVARPQMTRDGEDVAGMIHALQRERESNLPESVASHALEYITSLLLADFDAYEAACGARGLTLIPDLEEPGSLHRSGLQDRVPRGIDTRDHLRELWAAAARRIERIPADRMLIVTEPPTRTASHPASLADRFKIQRGYSSLFIDPDAEYDTKSAQRTVIYIPLQAANAPEAVLRLEYLWHAPMNRWAPYRLISAAAAGEPLDVHW